ncbi:MAG: cysteine synthase A [Clostridia bacterium]|nr:cysteine synthase A [Clostridia bacterium]
MSWIRSVEDRIGNTPLLRLAKLKSAYGFSADIYAKLEYLNAGGSIKDRVAKAMIDDAEKSGRLQAGGTVIEPTSGNTGVGLALVAAARGYQSVIVMPDTMSVERQKLIKAYGAKVVLTDGKKGMQGAVERAEEILKNTPNAIIAGQFDNPANPQAHYDTTASEIYEAMNGSVDIFVAGVGTGGTLTGVGKYLKERNPNVRIVAVEPFASPLLSKGVAGAHGLQGIGANFIPKVLDRSVYDEVLTVTEEDAYAQTRALSAMEGAFAGISSGANVAAAIALAKRAENKGKKIVTVLPDSGDRYLSTKVFD